MSIYAVDYNNQGRSEHVQVIDASTGTVLDSRTITAFKGGEYLTWKLSGDVNLLFTSLSGPNSVVSGIFFGQNNAATFVSQDTTTEGNWKGVYGAAGYDIAGDLMSLPSYAALTTTNTTLRVWYSSTTMKQALQKADPGATDRVGAAWYSNHGPFSIDVNFTDGLTHTLSIYAADLTNYGRAEQVKVVDPSTGKVLDTRNISAFSTGVYLTWKVKGNVQIIFTGTAGPNPVLSGIFFDS